MYICTIKLNEMVEDKQMWDEEIFEIKVGGVKDGLSYRVGQVLTLRVGGETIRRVIDNIRRVVIEEEVVYQVFTCNEKKEDYQITKAFIGLPVYFTFKT